MRRPWFAALRSTVITSLLFVVVYNVTNQLTHLRSDTGTWAFEWERLWPVVPWMIVPYWSIDLLFILAPFLSRTHEEIALHHKRIVFVIVGGGLTFLLIPLQFTFPRPQVEGIFAPWFTALYTFDHPHNLFPSLHIALRTLLADFYGRQVHRHGRWLVHGHARRVKYCLLYTSPSPRDH
jgi:hypothetical protein